MTPLYATIRAVAGRPGRPANDPAILVALWLYAIVEGISSVRALDYLCTHHHGFRWMCGGVSLNYHTLADFRVAHLEFLDNLLTHSVAVLLEQELVDLNRVAQDGMRVRASVGAASFRRRLTLEQCLQEAQTQVQRLRAELETDPGQAKRQQQKARGGLACVDGDGVGEGDLQGSGGDGRVCQRAGTQPRPAAVDGTWPAQGQGRCLVVRGGGQRDAGGKPGRGTAGTGLRSKAGQSKEGIPASGGAWQQTSNRRRHQKKPLPPANWSKPSAKLNAPDRKSAADFFTASLANSAGFPGQSSKQVIKGAAEKRSRE